jgi:hypothetical protein
MLELVDAMQFFADWLGDLKESSDAWFEHFLLWFAALYIEMKIWTLEIAWGFSSAILESFNLGSIVSSAFSGIDSKTLLYLNFFRLIDCANLLLNAVVTRFILNLVGW